LERFIEGTPQNKTVRHPVDIFPHMSSWEDHEEMIDDQYLMESIEEDQKLDSDEEDLEDEEQ
jgi:hypothetical protein